MTREDFYHSRHITFLQRLVSIGYSTCGCCGKTIWNSHFNKFRLVGE